MSLLVISSYPEKHKTHDEKTVGGASYAKNTILFIKKQNPDLKITVFAEEFNGFESYIDDGDILVKRIWKRNNISSLIKLFFEVLKNKDPKILIEFEMFMFGGLIYTSVFLLTLGLLKIFGKQNYLVLHQVVSDLSSFEKNTIKRLVYSSFRKILYSYLYLISNKIIVFEEYLKEILNLGDKIVVIPHAVEQKSILDKKESKQRLELDINQKYILSFGYISPYKGIDKFIENYPNKTDYKLIVAGGINPNHSKNPEYIDFVDKVKIKASEIGAISIGFVKESEIELYFSACDIVVLPYQTFMSSSGPLALAFSYEKPVMLSSSLEKYFLTNDFKIACEGSNLNPQDFLFEFSDISIKDRINYISLNRAKFVKFSSNIKSARSWETISKCYQKEIF